MKEIRLDSDASVRRSEPGIKAQTCSITYSLSGCNLPEVFVAELAMW
jgi:hypothetical protein